MRARARATTLLSARRACALAAGLALCACASSDTARLDPSAAGGESGFVVSERVRVGAGVRADFERAVELLEHERYEDGIAVLAEVTEAAPRATAAHIDLGIARGRVGDLEGARASLEQALALNPRHPVAHNELGIVYRKLARFADARRSYEQALALHPDFHFAQRNLAILCDLYLADLDCALEHYERYAQLAPADETAAKWLADLRARSGR